MLISVAVAKDCMRQLVSAHALPVKSLCGAIVAISSKRIILCLRATPASPVKQISQFLTGQSATSSQVSKTTGCSTFLFWLSSDYIRCCLRIHQTFLVTEECLRHALHFYVAGYYQSSARGKRPNYQGCCRRWFHKKNIGCSSLMLQIILRVLLSLFFIENQAVSGAVVRIILVCDMLFMFLCHQVRWRIHRHVDSSQ